MIIILNHFRLSASQFLIKSKSLSCILEFELLEIYTSSKLKHFKIYINYSCFSLNFIYYNSFYFSALHALIFYSYFFNSSIVGGTVSAMCSLFDFSFEIYEISWQCFSLYFYSSFYDIFTSFSYNCNYLFKSGFLSP